MCILSLNSTIGFFTLSLSPHNNTFPGLEWLEGNYGEGMEDNRVVARGSLRAINESLHTLAYRGVYRLNDTIGIKITDGEFVVETRVMMVYTTENKKDARWQFVVVVMVVIGMVVVWGVVACAKLLQSCCCSRKKGELVKKEIEMVDVDTEKKTSSPTLTKKTSPPALTKKKRLPPPLPPSLLPKHDGKKQTHSTVTTPENVEPHSKTSVRPPTVGM